MVICIVENSNLGLLMVKIKMGGTSVVCLVQGLKIRKDTEMKARRIASFVKYLTPTKLIKVL